MSLKHGHSKDIISHNIRELRKAGHPVHQSIAMAIHKAHKMKKFAKGGEVLSPDKELFHEMQYEHEETGEGLTMEPPRHRQVQSGGPILSDARDRDDMGPAEPYSSSSDMDKGSVKMHDGGASPEDGQFMSPALKEILRKRKFKYSR